MDIEVRKVIAAWVLDGDNPDQNKTEKEMIRKNWPSLACAIDDLVLRDYLNREK